MDLNEIKALMDRFDTSACTVLELEEGNLRLRLEKGTAPVSAAPEIQATPAAPGAAAPQPAPAEEGQTLNAPLVGTFYAAPAPGEAPFVKAGDQVRKGQTVCVLEAMKMMSEVPAPADCIIEEVLVKDGELVGFSVGFFSPTGARSRCGSSGPAGSWRSRQWRCTPPPTGTPSMSSWPPGRCASVRPGQRKAI